MFKNKKAWIYFIQNVTAPEPYVFGNPDQNCVPNYQNRTGAKTSVADPKQKFRIRFRIRIRIPELNMGPNPGFGSRSETGHTYFSAFPELRDLATNKVRNKFAGFESGPIRARNRGSGSVPTCHGSTTLRTTTYKCEICIIV
jgi:hypothetical protein